METTKDPKTMTNNELKDKLRELKLKTTGNKAELLGRLTNALAGGAPGQVPKEPVPDKPSPSQPKTAAKAEKPTKANKPEVAETEVPKELKKLKLPELKAILDGYNLSKTGNKDVLIERILKHRAGSSATPASESAKKKPETTSDSTLNELNSKPQKSPQTPEEDESVSANESSEEESEEVETVTKVAPIPAGGLPIVEQTKISAGRTLCSPSITRAEFEIYLKAVLVDGVKATPHKIAKHTKLPIDVVEKISVSYVALRQQHRDLVNKYITRK
jgi:hypothetical protein